MRARRRSPCARSSWTSARCAVTAMPRRFRAYPHRSAPPLRVSGCGAAWHWPAVDGTGPRRGWHWPTAGMALARGRDGTGPRQGWHWPAAGVATDLRRAAAAQGGGADPNWSRRWLGSSSRSRLCRPALEPAQDGMSMCTYALETCTSGSLSARTHDSHTRMCSRTVPSPTLAAVGIPLVPHAAASGNPASTARRSKWESR